MSDTKEQYATAWRALEEAAWAHERGNMAGAQRLKDAALALARAHAALNGKAGNPARTTGGALVPFGRSKGRTVGECDSKDLRWLLGAVGESVDDPSKEKWRAKNVELRDAIQAELEARGDA